MLTFGKRNKIIFSSYDELFYTIGFIASKKRTDIVWENNHINGAAWGAEGRICCLKEPHLFPTVLQNKFTAGNGTNILYRINCNEFINFLKLNHKIDMDIDTIRKTIPNIYLSDFEKGLVK